MSGKQDELVFVPLGGLGEIGMNMALYGFGPPGRRKWIMVDCGITFAGPDLPGIDVLMAKTDFIEKMKKDLLAIVITHAHEDHIGALPYLWHRFGCEVYATQFAANLLETKRLMEEGAPDIDIKLMRRGRRFQLGPFDIEPVAMAHSIPESVALAIRTELGTLLHTGDWKLDDEPGVSWATDHERLREIGDEGVDVLICDSTNILRDGESPSEADVAANLRDLIAASGGRVLVTTFASNVARLKAAAEAGVAAGRRVALVGRAMDRVSDVARELGYLEGLPEFLTPETAAKLPRGEVLILATGSQGEGRAAMARIADDSHPNIRLAPGDKVIFSSRPIPGNERAINNIINGLARQGIEVITDRTDLVHVSGHPRRAEVEKLYGWVRPRLVIPAHGEEMHLAGHAAFARARGVEVVKAHNGEAVLLAPGKPGIVDEVPHGRQLLDGRIFIEPDDPVLRARRKLAFAGIISIGIAVSGRGEVSGDPDVLIEGIPARTADGRAMDGLVDEVIFDVLDNLPRARLRDPDSVANALERAVRSAVHNVWGKRPHVHVLVVEV